MGEQVRIDHGYVPGYGSIVSYVSPEAARTIWKAQNEYAVWRAEQEQLGKGERDG